VVYVVTGALAGLLFTVGAASKKGKGWSIAGAVVTIAGSLLASLAMGNWWGVVISAKGTNGQSVPLSEFSGPFWMVLLAPPVTLVATLAVCIGQVLKK
jgi:hypothetical protein